MRPAFVFRLLLLIVSVQWGFAFSGCSGAAVIKDPERPAMFGTEVDSVVVEPFRLSGDASTGLNEVDLGLFQELLAEQLGKRPFLRLFAEPPTDLPNTIVLEGELREFDARELPGDEVFLREIHIAVELRIRVGGDRGEPRTIRRDFTYQKIYLPSQDIPVASFDLRDAAGEVAEMLAEAIYPSTAADLPLADGIDPDNGVNMAHPLLLRGNRFAIKHRFGRAKDIWRLLLFDPEVSREGQEAKKTRAQLFRISRRGLRLLKEAGVEEETLARLEPLKLEKPMEMAEFRKKMRKIFGGPTKRDGEILNQADYAVDRQHFNLAAAHRNLAILYWLESRYDRAAYHLGRAHLNYPLEEYLTKWAKIQQSRGLLPEDLSEEEAISLFQRLPPPRGMMLEPGSTEDALFTPVVFEQPARPAEEENRDAASEGEAGREDSGGSLDLQPVERLPVEREEQPEGQPLPPIESAQSAQNR